jgi:segregation and condensation protein B
MTDTDSPETEIQTSDNDLPSRETKANESEASSNAPDPQLLRLLEAVLFASAEPMDEATIATRLPEGSDVPGLIAALVEIYANRGVNLVQAGGKWLFRSAEDLAPAMRVYANPQRKLSRAAIETLAIVAYHQPITRAEMEEIRGVGLSKGTIDMLFEQGWITPRGRRQTPGKPVTWGSTDKFLTDFGIESIESLPGMDELKAAGLLDKRPAIQITDAALPAEEEPLSPEEQEKLAEDAAFLAALDSEAAEAEARGADESGADAAVAESDENASDENDDDENFGDDDSDDDLDDDLDDEPDEEPEGERKERGDRQS